MEPTEFFRCVVKAEAGLNRADIRLRQVRYMVNHGDMDGAYRAAFDFEEELEKLTLLARAMPAYTGRPEAQREVDSVLAELIPVDMGFTRQGWFCLRLPMLLPKKGGGSPLYIQQILYPAMRRFFADKPPVSYDSCVLIYRHIYDAQRPERAYRDHDNIELNMVTDIIALYLLPDDAPGRCSHFYCSTSGLRDGTEVFIVPREQFQLWLYMAAQGALKEVQLLEDRP